MAQVQLGFAPLNDLTHVETLLQQIENNTDSLEVNTDGLELLVTTTNTKLDALIAQQDKELVYTSAVKANNGSTNFYIREAVVYDSETASEVSRTAEYSLDGKVWDPSLPISGTITAGWIQPAALEFNDQETFEIVNAMSMSFPANQYHSISFVILEGTAEVIVGGNTISNLPATFSEKYEASTYLANDIVINAGPTSRIVVTTIK